MTTAHAEDGSADRRSRRTLLAGGAAAAALFAAEAAQPGVAQAANPPVLMDQLNDAGSGATDWKSTNATRTLGVFDYGGGNGIQGNANSSIIADTAGVYGNNDSSGPGVKGTSAGGRGVEGFGSTVGVKGTATSDAGIGVEGIAAASGFGVRGDANSQQYATAVYASASDNTSGSSGAIALAATASEGLTALRVDGPAQFESSVTAIAADSLGDDVIVATLPDGSTGTNAISGSSQNQANGVNAESNSPYTIGQDGHFNAALFAQNISTGTALWARNLNAGGQGGYIEAYGVGSVGLTALGGSGATALDVQGPAVFSRSGIATIKGTTAAPKSQISATNVALTASSIVLAVIQGAGATGVSVQNVALNVTGSSFTIHLTQAVTTTVKVGWFVVN